MRTLKESEVVRVWRTEHAEMLEGVQATGNCRGKSNEDMGARAQRSQRHTRAVLKHIARSRPPRGDG
eukprot:CAMPEP_0168366242 /NCGR_PEP_ID=MMETSP0228-20121227/5125_1 /TAXON_ID=133427 /ORGANISM="Protoceratium reticulatum, Strain CCCM 535 (=CCMP 1889)" /LENGTH=66 /DNA_ID=CAMNT_0008379033 /DNA_START=778 /DNA_END=975 /DNA_ORIENTATION=+